jgi:PTH1 family peptidyl-tRNA hydrolase
LKIVLGLGNPGLRYRSTRHNVGFKVLDHLAGARGIKFRAAGEMKKYAWRAESGTVVLAKPRTYMNRSGRAAAALCRHYGLTPSDLLVVYDDADLPLGRIRLRKGGGSGGHNGIKSIMEVLGTGEFARVRLGVRGDNREDSDLADYVLDRFDRDELPLVDELIELGIRAVEGVLAEGIEAAMNRFNRFNGPEEGG